MKEGQPIPEEIIFREPPLVEKEVKLPICGGCGKRVNDRIEEVQLRYQGKLYHEDCFKMEIAKEGGKNNG